MKFGKRDFLVGVIGALCVTVYSYHYFFLSNTTLYNALSYCIPGLLALNACAFVASLLWKRKISTLISFLVLIYSGGLFKSVWVFPLNRGSSETADLSVLSYNVGSFNLDRFHTTDSLRLSDSIVIARQKEFLKKCDADVICLQEFYNNDALDFTTVLNEMTDMGYKYFYTNPIRIEGYQGFFGVITFSKFPIVGKGKISFEYKENKRALNTAIYTDIEVGKDTVRVVNVHLHSMDLRAKRVLSSLPSDTLVDELNLFKEKMEYGFIKRGIQVLRLEEEILKKKGNIILVGDLNDLPYSFSYRKIKAYLKNSFEEAGSGFGFTYNRFPWFIRIDNQFCSPSIDVTSFEVLKQNNLSDHYPIAAGYKL